MAISVLAALWLVILGSRNGRRSHLAGGELDRGTMAARVWWRFKHDFALQ
jgi:hypothetical protein